MTDDAVDRALDVIREAAARRRPGLPVSAALQADLSAALKMRQAPEPPR